MIRTLQGWVQLAGTVLWSLDFKGWTGLVGTQVTGPGGTAWEGAPAWTAWEGAPALGRGHVWPWRIPGDQVTGEVAAPPSPPAQLPPSPGAGLAVNSLFQCRCLTRRREGTKALPFGLAWLFPVSQDLFATPASLSAPFSTDGTRLTPGRASFMTSGPADCSRRQWCVPSFLQATRATQCFVC